MASPSHAHHRGNTEPVWSPAIQLTLHSSAIDDNYQMTVNGTCHHCRVSSIPVNSTSPMIFAIGPSLDLSSDDLDARIRRHTAYGPSTTSFSLPQISPTSSP